MKKLSWLIIPALLIVLFLVFQPKNENQKTTGSTTVTAAIFTKYAQDLGLDQEKFGACLASGKYEEPAKNDYQEGIKAGVNATPTIFINGRKLVGNQPFSEVQKIIDEELGTPSVGVERVNISTSGAATKGPENAKVVINEFSDYQCPFCGKFAQTTEPQIFQTYGDKIRYIFHDFPFPFHKEALEAAQAARCGGEQNKYWEFHDLLFQKQDEWGKE